MSMLAKGEENWRSLTKVRGGVSFLTWEKIGGNGNGNGNGNCRAEYYIILPRYFG